MRILVIDDENGIPEPIGDILTRLGHEVMLANNGEQALCYMQEEHFTAVFSDLRMPGMGGIALLHEIVKPPQAPPVVLLTGHADMTSAIEALRLGAFDYLQKPFDVKMISACLLRLEKHLETCKLLEAEKREHMLTEAVAQSLRQSEERYRCLFEASNDPIFIFTVDGNIIDTNSQASAMLGYDCEEMLSMSLSELHPEKIRIVVMKYLERFKEEGSVRFESQLQRSNGTIVDVEISASIIDSEKGIGQSVVRDITLRKELQKKQRKAEQITPWHLPPEIRQASRRVTAATGSMSLKDVECKQVRAAIQAASGNLSQAARTLKISRRTLYRKIEKYGLK